MKKIKLTIYIKFALFILIGSIVPIAILSTVILDEMFTVYKESLEEIYTQEFKYSTYGLATLMEGYNDISKAPYYYVPSSSDDILRANSTYNNLYYILTGEAFPYAIDTTSYTEKEMNNFFNNLLTANSSIAAIHFVYEEDGEKMFYHAGNQGELFASEEKFLQIIDLNSIDKESKKLQVFPAHDLGYMGYTYENKDKVITVARNYFDNSGQITEQKYLGTLLVDIRIAALDNIFKVASYSDVGSIYLYDTSGLCVYSSDEAVVGKVLNLEWITGNSKNELILTEYLENYGIYLTIQIDTLPLNEQMIAVQRIMYLFVFISIMILLGSSLAFSGHITKPIRALMRRMAEVETGQFIEQLPVTSDDEIGQLTARFNQMTEELINYTNQVYVAKIQQKEAELVALKSQIYPHFLYNTLEVIRMTAISQQDEKVALMIESLSDQIRYLIGTVSDMVPLSLEIDILHKYMYLINCRYDYEVEFITEDNGLGQQFIPKLILQPLVENAFMHGIKPKRVDGAISLVVTKESDVIEIEVMDNGQGIDVETIKEIQQLLASEEPGKKEEYQWHSIGLKNVHDRVRFLYGEQYGLSVSSTLDVGTVIKITLPVNTVERGEGNAENDISG